jgi:hypothetical protein
VNLLHRGLAVIRVTKPIPTIKIFAKERALIEKWLKATKENARLVIVDLKKTCPIIPMAALLATAIQS